VQTGQNVVETTNDVGDDEELIEKVYSLARPLAKRTDHEERDEDEHLEMFGEEDNSLAEKLNEVKAIKSLFKGCVFLLNREVPKEALTMIIRNSGGSAGWDNGPNNITSESKSVTHHIIDRPLSNFDVNRRYVQPQWVFDSLNARRKLPIEKYMPGVALPPHFSPFTKEKAGDYVPMERLEELRSLGQDVAPLMDSAPAAVPDQKPKKIKKVVTEEKGMRVALGKMHKKNKQLELDQEGAARKLRESMIPKKLTRVYHSIKTKTRKDKTENSKLKTKRMKIEGSKGKATSQ
jgi:pescadillo protein